jgi:DNA invertase Pin-like site-specific DNA recombinase
VLGQFQPRELQKELVYNLLENWYHAPGPLFHRSKPVQTAYSYLRFSSPAQADGDSFRRQTQGTLDWCKRHDVQLDIGRTYQDRGRSGYHGRHLKPGAELRAFLDQVEQGQIDSGSILILENLDRLSRQSPWISFPILCGIINAGIEVVTLSPFETRYRASDIGALYSAMNELSRGFSESKSKSDRGLANWSAKRQVARMQGKLMTKHVPGWVVVSGGKLALHPERAATVRLIFRLAIDGFGLSKIVQHLIANKVPAWGASKTWSRGYVRRVLSTRTVLGEHQPTSQGNASGDVIRRYYPPVVGEADFDRAQAAILRRKQVGGRTGKRIFSIFGGLLYEAQTGQPIRVAWQVQGVGDRRQKVRMMTTAAAMEARAKATSFRYDVFETAVLSLLKEIDPASLLGPEPEGQSRVLADKVASKEARLTLLEAEITSDDGDVPTLARVIKKLTAEVVDLQKALAAARARESCPRLTSWTEAMSLVDALEDERGRLRLGELVRQLVREIRILVIPRKSHRFLACQLFFDGDKARSYLIWHQGRAHGRPGGWAAVSLDHAVKAGDLDLRNPKHAKALEKKLLSVDIASLVDEMKVGK